MSNEYLKTCEQKMDKGVDHLARELAAVRAGRANPAVLDKISLDYYGTPTPINQVAAVSVAEARILTIAPWDSSLMNLIEKAILTSDIGINPTNDGKIMRLVFPSPTEERRKTLSKEILKLGEEAKITIRGARRDTIEACKTMKKNAELTEDDLKNAEHDVQKLTDKKTKQIDAMCETKTKEVMEL